MGEEEEESSEALLQKKQTKELKKVKAARQRTHARFETLLNVGSGSEEVSESTPVQRRSKKKERTRTADSVTIIRRQSPNLKKRQSRSQENLLEQSSNDTNVESASLKEKAKLRKQKQTREKESSSLQPKPKEKKKKLSQRPQPQEQDNELESVMSAENDGFEHSFNSMVDDNTQHIAHDENNQIESADEPRENMEERKKKTRKKKKKQKVSSSERIMKALVQKYEDENLLLCILLHRCDQLKPDARIHHPVVRVHIVDMETGQYVKKRDKYRNVTSILESENENVDYILPVISQPFDFKLNRTLVPSWEETVLYNEMYSYFLQREQNDPKVVLFFEVLDFMQMNLKNKEFAKTDKGWYRIAWAFLKLVSPTTGVPNTDKRVRLQLYQPLSRVSVKRKDNAAIEILDCPDYASEQHSRALMVYAVRSLIFQWWMYGTRQKYNSTLYVTVKGVTSPEPMNPAIRSTFPTQQERGAMTFEELNNTLEENVNQSDYETSQHIWTKLPGQMNRIPNKVEVVLPTGRRGCSVVQFSHDGRYIACACSTNEGYPIMVYEFPESKRMCSFSNHFGIVYDLEWSKTGKELLSASADTTVRCWDTKRFTSGAIKLFPHPSYVYTAKYHPQQQNLVITGSYDKTIRVWNKMSSGNNADLLKELCHSIGFVNTLVLTKDGERMFSGDSEGVFLEWNTRLEKKKKVDVEEQVNRWSLLKKIELEELKRTPINTLKLHASEKKLLIHTKDSVIRMFDLRSYGILKLYVGGMNRKEHIHLTMSPCGSFVFCGTENGVVNVWNTETGDLVYTYKELGYVRAICDVDFHPHDNYIVFCCYGDGHPVFIYGYDPKVYLETQPPQTQRAVTPVSEKLLESQRNLDETTELYKSLRTAASINNDTKRMERVQHKLLSVTKPTSILWENKQPDDFSSTRNRVTFKDMSPTYNNTSPSSQQQQTMHSTWGSDFSYTTTSGYPSSPHAQQHLGSSSRYFTSDLPVSPNPLSGSINMQFQDNTLTTSQLDTTSTPKPVFKFEESVEQRKSPLPREKVVALYDYKPNRADELWIKANEVITVLYKDNENWWMGQTEDGRQGYFPVNYVIVEDEVDESSVNESTKQPTASALGDSVKAKKKGKKTTHAAVIDQHGDLRIISGTEESDTGNGTERRTKKKRKQIKSNEFADSVC